MLVPITCHGNMVLHVQPHMHSDVQPVQIELHDVYNVKDNQVYDLHLHGGMRGLSYKHWLAVKLLLASDRDGADVSGISCKPLIIVKSGKPSLCVEVEVTFNDGSDITHDFEGDIEDGNSTIRLRNGFSVQLKATAKPDAKPIAERNADVRTAIILRALPTSHCLTVDVWTMIARFVRLLEDREAGREWEDPVQHVAYDALNADDIVRLAQLMSIAY